MKLDVGMIYHLTLTAEEFNLVGRALRGTLKPEELEKAQELQRAMAESRIALGKHYTAELNKLENNLKKT